MRIKKSLWTMLSLRHIKLIDLRIAGLNAFALANRIDGKLRRIMFFAEVPRVACRTQILRIR